MKIQTVLQALKKEYAAIEPSPFLVDHGWDALYSRIQEDQIVWRKPLFLGACLMIVLLITTGGTVYAAQTAKPGDLLYGVKVASERVVAQLAPQPWKDHVVETLLERRVEQVKEVSDHDDVKRQQQAEDEYVRTVDTLRSAGALRSDTATKAAQKAAAIIEDIKKKEPKNEEKKDDDLKNIEKKVESTTHEIRGAPVSGPDIPPLPSVAPKEKIPDI